MEEESQTCNNDFLRVQDVENDGSLGSILGTYCNTNKPPGELFSSWNELLVQFSSDSQDERTGFMIKYESIQYSSQEGMAWQTDHPGMYYLYMHLFHIYMWSMRRRYWREQYFLVFCGCLTRWVFTVWIDILTCRLSNCIQDLMPYFAKVFFCLLLGYWPTAFKI